MIPYLVSSPEMQRSKLSMFFKEREMDIGYQTSRFQKHPKAPSHVTGVMMKYQPKPCIVKGKSLKNDHPFA